MALTQTSLCNLALSKIGNEGVQITDFDTDTGKAARQCRLHYEQTLEELVRMHSWNCTKARAQLVETVPLIVDSDDVNFTYEATVNTKAQFAVSTDDDYIQWNSTLERWERDNTALPFSAVFYAEATDDVPPEGGWKKVSDDTDAGFTLTLTYDFGWDYEFLLPTDCIRPLHLSNESESERFLRPLLDWAVEERSIKSNVRPVYLLYIKEPDPTDMDALFANAFYTLLASKLAIPVMGDRQVASDLMMEFLQVVMPEARRVNAFEGNRQPVVDSEWLEATYTSIGNLGSSWPPVASTYINGSGFGGFS